MSVTEAPDLTLEIPADAELEPRPEDQPPGDDLVNVPLTCASVFLATAGAGWMAAGVFPGAFPRVVALAGAAIGVGVVAGSFRTSRPSLVQYLALPAAVVAGAVLVIPDATGGTANLPSLVAEAVRTGGIAQPPVPFDPGWRFLLLVLTSFVGSAAASLGTGLNRARLGLLIPMPLLIGAALVQPQEASAISTIVALGFAVAALAVSYGVELAREGATSGSFEARRLVRGAGALGALVVVLIVLSQAGFLFPDTERDQVIPPSKPERQPPQRDRVLFEVTSDRPGPWRLGVLDVYQQDGWAMPPYDTKRFQEVGEDGSIPPAPAGRADAPAPRAAGEQRETYEVTFRVADMEGHVVPTVAESSAVERRDPFPLQFDPRTQMLRLPQSRASEGMTYTVRAPTPP
ncbi:MAG TPA: hypothetical protein VM840_05475, partial [Actinomycetota bacterium]|nr:hypothetical protein [Actinomycetota bacterium]